MDILPSVCFFSVGFLFLPRLHTFLYQIQMISTTSFERNQSWCILRCYSTIRLEKLSEYTCKLRQDGWYPHDITSLRLIKYKAGVPTISQQM
jgi:hypothetical protein